MGKFFKTASKLRKAVQVVFGRPQEKGTLQRIALRLKKSGKEIGALNIRMGDPLDPSPRPQVISSQIATRYKGLGLGKKLYGDVILRHGGLDSDAVGGQTEDAKRLWKSLYRLYPRAGNQGVKAF